MPQIMETEELSPRPEHEGARGGGGGLGDPGGDDVTPQIMKLELKVEALDEKVGKVGTAVRGLQTDMTSVKGDIKWIKWIIGVSAPLILTAFVYLINRQNTMGDQMIDLLQQLVNKP